MPPFFTDTFTVAAACILTDHTPDVGTSWTEIITGACRAQIVNTGSGVRSNANSGNTGWAYTADATYPSANYEIQFESASILTSIRPVYVLARVQDASNLYAVRLVPSGSSQLYKKVAGTWTALGSQFTEPATNSICKLIVNGTALSFQDDGVTVASATDSAIAAAGKAGLGMGGGPELVNNTDDLAAVVVIDEFNVTDLGGGAAGDGLTPGLLQPMGIIW